MQLLDTEKKASEELNNLEVRVNSDISKASQDGNYSQVKTALNDYLASIDEIESAGGAEQTVKGDWQQLLSDQKSGNTSAVQTDETTLQADVNTAVTAIQTASTGLDTVIQDIKGSTTVTSGTTQTVAPTINGTPIAGDTSVSGTAIAGANVVLSVNEIAQPAVTVDSNGNWTVSGLTLASGDSISVTAQVAGEAVSNADTVTVVAPNSSVQSGFTFTTVTDDLTGDTIVNVTGTAANVTGVTVKGVAATYISSLSEWRAILTGTVTVSASDITLTTASTN
jgi:hypothetical protein